MRRSVVVLLVVLTTVSIASAADLKSGQASGNLTIDGKPLALKYAIAATGPDTFDDTKEAIYLLLTPKPVPQSAIDAAATFDDLRRIVDDGIAYKFQNGDHFHVTARNKGVLKDRELQSSASLMDAPPVTVGAAAVSGSITPWKGEDEEIGDHKMNYNVAFNAPIARRFAIEKPVVIGAKAKKLPAGGGEPGKAYLAEKCAAPKIPKDAKEVEAMMAKEGLTPTDDDLKKMSKEAGKPVTRADVAKQFLEMATAMSALQQTDCKVMGGLQDGDAAIIQVQASQMKIRQATDVTMVKEASGWKVKKEGAWHNP